MGSYKFHHESPGTTFFAYARMKYEVLFVSIVCDTNPLIPEKHGIKF